MITIDLADKDGERLGIELQMHAIPHAGELLRIRSAGVRDRRFFVVWVDHIIAATKHLPPHRCQVGATVAVTEMTDEE